MLSVVERTEHRRAGTGEVRVVSLDARPKEKVTTDAVVRVVVRTALSAATASRMMLMR